MGILMGKSSKHTDFPLPCLSSRSGNIFRRGLSSAKKVTHRVPKTNMVAWGSWLCHLQRQKCSLWSLWMSLVPWNDSVFGAQFSATHPRLSHLCEWLVSWPSGAWKGKTIFRREMPGSQWFLYFLSPVRPVPVGQSNLAEQSGNIMHTSFKIASGKRLHNYITMERSIMLLMGKSTS
jgi:hypothetical protein